jgi:hypothetical protein
MNKQWIVAGQEFAVGNVVRVMRQVEDLDPNGMGDGVAWPNTWVGFYGEAGDNTPYGMNKCLGMSFVIADISEEGVEFEGAGELSFLFPLACLDFISATKQVKDAA